MLFCDGSCNLIAERNNDSVFVTRTATKETFLARQSLRSFDDDNKKRSDAMLFCNLVVSRRVLKGSSTNLL